MKLVIVGFGAEVVTVKLVELVPVPFGVDTPILPVLAPVGTWAVMSVEELTTKLESGVLLKVTCVAPVKLVPRTSTCVPTGPLVGLNEVTVGGLPLPPGVNA